MIKDDRKPSDVMTKGSFINAIVALAGIGGSTNAVVHLLAIAGRLGIKLTLDDFDKIGSNVPLLANLQPAGTHLMEDFFNFVPDNYLLIIIVVVFSGFLNHNLKLINK